MMSQAENWPASWQLSTLDETPSPSRLPLPPPDAVVVDCGQLWRLRGRERDTPLSDLRLGFLIVISKLDLRPNYRVYSYSIVMEVLQIECEGWAKWLLRFDSIQFGYFSSYVMQNYWQHAFQSCQPFPLFPPRWRGSLRGRGGAAQRVGKYPGSWSLHLVGHMQIRIGKSLAHSPNAPGGNPLVIL